MTTAPEQFTLKGRVGDFEYGYTGKCRWIVRDRRDGVIVAKARDLAGASREATRFHLGGGG